MNSAKTAIVGSAITHSSTYSTTFTSAEMLSLASYIPNANSSNMRIIATTVYDGVTYTNYKDGTYSVINANPTFSNFTYEDTDTSVIALTGSNQKIVKGYSNLRATVTTANKGVANKGATMSTYRLVVGSKQVDVAYSSSASVLLNLSDIDNNVFTVYAIDSRGNSTSKQISPSSYVSYFSQYFGTPVPSGTRTSGIGTETTLAYTGTFYNDSFGSVSNTLTLSYKYKKTTESTYTTGSTSITPTISGKYI